jgi:hypothetical protein
MHLPQGLGRAILSVLGPQLLDESGQRLPHRQMAIGTFESKSK